MTPARLIGNLVASVVVILIAATALDGFAVWLGWRPIATCYLFPAVDSIATTVGFLLMTVGLVSWTVSIFKSQGALGLLMGGVLLAMVPMLMQDYLGAQCMVP